MPKQKHYVRLCIALAVLLAVTSCGLPKNAKEMADRTKQHLGAVEKEIASLKKQYEDYQKTDEYMSEFRIYAERENWDNQFTKASDELSNAKQMYDSNVAPILDRNRKKDVSKLARQLGQVNRRLKIARSHARRIAQRRGEIQDAKKRAPEMLKQAEEKTVGLSDKLLRSLKGVSEQTKRLHTHKEKDVDSQFAKFVKLYDDSKSALKVAQGELKKDMPDYARFSDSCALIASNYDTMQKSGEKFKARQKELDVGYAKILDDMRLIYQVQVGRTSWDEGSDFAREHTYIYRPVNTDQKTYEYFARVGGKEIAKLSSYSGGRKHILVDAPMWQALRIAWGERWPSRYDNHASYWINDLPVVFQHRYVYVKNGVKSTGQWETVPEVFYENHEDDLGMMIVSKPIGYYESEVIKQATPPGLAMVGNPKYGEWKKDPKTGDRFWSFYGKYMFWGSLLGGRRYYYNDWNDWNRNYRGRKPYYGRGGYWGSYGRHAQTRYSDRSAYKGGHIKAEKPSVRAAGPGSRGRGPGLGH